jgi:hypothetical protein
MINYFLNLIYEQSLANYLSAMPTEGSAAQ